MITAQNLPIVSPVVDDVIITGDSLSFVEWLSANWWWVALAAILVWTLTYPIRRYLRQLRRREPWSLEKAGWAQSGFHPTSRIVRKYHRYNRRSGGLR